MKSQAITICNLFGLNTIPVEFIAFELDGCLSNTGILQEHSEIVSLTHRDGMAIPGSFALNANIAEA
jgi:hypothetical protein